MDQEIGSYPMFLVYDLDPRATDGRALIVRYKIVDPQGNQVQTQKMAAKHIQSARLEAERKERMAKKNPALNNTIKVKMPDIFRPARAVKKALEALNGSQ